MGIRFVLKRMRVPENRQIPLFLREKRNMKSTRLFLFTAILAVLILIGCAMAAQTVTISSVTMNANGTGTATLTLDAAPSGLSGGTFTIAVTDPTKAEIESWAPNALAEMKSNTALPASSTTIQEAFLYTTDIPANSTNVVLGTATLKGLGAGSTSLTASFTNLDGNSNLGTPDYTKGLTVVPGTINIYSVPVAAFTFTPSSPIIGDTVTFTDASAGNPVSYAWNFGDGATSTSKNPTHAYTAAGTYTVTESVTNPAGTNTATQSVVVTSAPVPVANFTATPVYGTAPLSATFADASTNTPTAWTWEYRASGTSNSWTTFATTQNPTYSFPAGAYDIRLTAANSGGSNAITKTQYISSSAGAKRLSSVTSGSVSGDLYVGAFGPWSSTTSYATNTVEETFAIPTFTNIQWARLYTVVYGSSADARAGTAAVSFAGDSSTYSTLGSDTLATASDSTSNVYPVNNHVDKQYTDYQIQYDVTSLISSSNPKAKVVTSPVASNFDGRIKDVVLVVAYNDGDSDTVKYWVNDGFDFQPSSGSGAVTTTFATSPLTSVPTSATLQNVMLSSTDASYTFNGNAYTGANSAKSFGTNVWDVKSVLATGSDSSFVYTHTSGASYKTTLAVLKARYVTAPTAAFTLSAGDSTTNPASVGKAVTFTSTSTIPTTNNATTYAWSFGNGNTSSLQNPTNIYSASGTYNVTLSVTNEGGSSTATKTVYVTNKPIISLSPASATVNPAGTTTYNIVMDNAPAGLSGYDMYVNVDSSVATITAVSYPSSLTKLITASVPAGKVRISAADTNQNINPSTTGPYTLATITVQGVAVGSSDITLSGLNMDDDSGNAIDAVLNTGAVTVGSYAGPTAAFSANTTSGNAPLTVAFDSSASSGSITTYQWDFNNDGTIDSTAANPAWTYSSIGIYSVKLTVTGPGGSNTMLKNAYITVGDGVAPTVVMNATPTSGKYPLTVAFSAATTGNVASYSWDFGDGTSSTLAAPTHTYTWPATFTAKVTVTGTGGSASDAKTIIASQALPVAGIVANPTSGTGPLTVKFTDASTGTFSTYNWSFGDGSYSDEANPVHIFTSAGTYTVTHTVSGSAGTSDPAATTTITVTGLGVSFVSNVTTGVASAGHALPVSFTSGVTGAGGSTSYLWDFGDNSTSTEANPVHNYYGHLKSFTVTLTVTSGVDKASVTKTAYITTTPYIEAFPKYDSTGSITGYYSSVPADLDGDYVYEDINHNGRVDYDDVVAFYDALEMPTYANNWFTANTDVDNAYDYDYNGNGHLGFEDIVALHDKILYS